MHDDGSLLVIILL
uniref:Uncharacterized protein n=1 Tax=Arundo donax TaxID=35708 RepID=A0A0A9B4M0_ARUDO